MDIKTEFNRGDIVIDTATNTQIKCLVIGWVAEDHEMFGSDGYLLRYKLRPIDSNDQVAGYEYRRQEQHLKRYIKPISALSLLEEAFNEDYKNGRISFTTFNYLINRMKVLENGLK